MDHNKLPAPQFELPRPQAKPGQENLAPLEGSQDIPQATEVRNTETPAAPASALPTIQAVPAVDPLAAIKGIAPKSAPVPAALPVDDGMPADDGDLIEKAWVQKAKTIVEQTQNDPYKQTNEMNKVKKEYIQKRYKKDVKLNDE